MKRNTLNEVFCEGEERGRKDTLDELKKWVKSLDYMIDDQENKIVFQDQLLKKINSMRKNNE